MSRNGSNKDLAKPARDSNSEKKNRMKPHEQLIEIMRRHNAEQRRIAVGSLRTLGTIDRRQLKEELRAKVTGEMSYWMTAKVRHSVKVQRAIEVLLNAYGDDRSSCSFMKQFCIGLIYLDTKD